MSLLKLLLKKKFLSSLIIASIVCGTINSMSIGPNFAKESLLQPWSNVLHTKKHMVIAFKNEVAKQNAKKLLTKYINTIQDISELKSGLSPHYKLIIDELDAAMAKSNSTTPEHLTNTDGMISAFIARILKIKNSLDQLTDLRSLTSSFLHFFSSDVAQAQLESRQAAILANNIYQKEHLAESIKKIDELLIKNIGYENEAISEFASALIRAKIKTKLLGEDLTDEQLRNLSSQITEIVNAEYVSFVDQKYGQQFTFAVYLNIEESKEQKNDAVALEIAKYSTALRYLITIEKLCQHQESIAKQDVAKHIYASINKKVNGQITEELATKEFCKLTSDEQNILKRLYPGSTAFQLIFYNQLHSLSTKLDQIQKSEFALSQILTLTTTGSKLINLIKLKIANHETTNRELWVDYFKDQLKNYW
jgi:hypothetical protein